MTKAKRSMAIPLLALAIVAGVAGCGGSSGGSSSTVDPNAAEVSPPGDIPDNQAFVPYRAAGGAFSVTVPEGWARTKTPDGVQFTDKLNAVTVATAKGSVLTPASAKANEVPALAKSVPGFANPKVGTVTRKAGTAVLITYLADGKPDPVTGKVTTDEVERYVFSHKGVRATLTLSGPKGADNVDPWRTITDSLRWTA